MDSKKIKNHIMVLRRELSYLQEDSEKENFQLTPSTIDSLNTILDLSLDLSSEFLAVDHIKTLSQNDLEFYLSLQISWKKLLESQITFISDKLNLINDNIIGHSGANSIMLDKIKTAKERLEKEFFRIRQIIKTIPELESSLNLVKKRKTIQEILNEINKFECRKIVVKIDGKTIQRGPGDKKDRVIRYLIQKNQNLSNALKKIQENINSSGI